MNCLQETCSSELELAETMQDVLVFSPLKVGELSNNREVDKL